MFIDCDNSFTPQRFYQIGGDDTPSLTEHVMLFFPNTFEEQRMLVESLDNYVTPNLGLVIVDSISTLYRTEFQRVGSIFDLNRDLTRQLAYLANLTLTKKTACLITSQVRARIKLPGDGIEPVARRALMHFPRAIIRIQNSSTPRVREFILERLKGTHAEGHCLVQITQRGLANISS